MVFLKKIFFLALGLLAACTNASPKDRLGTTSEGTVTTAGSASTTGTTGTTGTITGTTTGTPAPTLTQKLGKRFIDFNAIKKNGKWLVQDQTPAQVLQLLTTIRTKLGTPFGILHFVEDEQPPGTLLTGTTTLVNDYLNQVQQIVGGPIVANLGLDYYSPPVGGNGYACADGSTGPNCFWQISSDLLALDVIANGPRAVSLTAWPTLNRCPADPNSCSPAQVKSVLEEIVNHGWTALFPEDIGGGPGPFITAQGVASGAVLGMRFSDSGMLVDPNLLAPAHAEPNVSVLFAAVNSQSHPCPLQSATDQFLANLTTAQKAQSITAIAQAQASEGYVFAYPVWKFANDPNTDSCDVGNGNPGYWDASTALQDDGTPMLDLIIQLMNTYN